MLVGTVLIVGFLLTFLNVYQLQQMRMEHAEHMQSRQDGPLTIVEAVAGKGTRTAPVVWISAKKVT